MKSSSRKLVNIFRGLLVLVILLGLYNGLWADPKYRSQISSWGEIWYGLMLTVLLSWGILEGVNYFLQRHKFGHLPAYFWFITAGLNGGDLFGSASLLFEIRHYDKLTHSINNFFVAWLVFAMVKQINQSYHFKLNRFLIYYLTFATVNVLGVLYEVLEVIGDYYLGAVNITSRFDTTSDLIFNNAGLALLLISDLVIQKIQARRLAKAANAETISSTALGSDAPKSSS